MRDVKSQLPMQAKPGRPREPRVDAAVIAATLELLAQDGYAQLTIDRVAARAGVGKASLYRRWPNKVSLVLEAVSGHPQRPSSPDTGSLRDDMLAYLQTLVCFRTIHSEAISAISGEALSNPQFGDAVRAAMAEPVLTDLRTIVERAIARGELPATCDVDLLIAVVPALLSLQRLLSGQLADEAFVGRIVDQFFSPVDE
ncbi:MAG: TetR/AcrR family transcriptional regulator [Thermoleophilia bacterium]